MFKKLSGNSTNEGWLIGETPLQKQQREERHTMVFCALILVFCCVYPDADAFAQMIDSTINRGADYIIGRLGPALFLFGIAVSGTAVAMGNMEWVKRGVYVFGGGICVLAARGIFNAVVSFAR